MENITIKHPLSEKDREKIIELDMIVSGGSSRPYFTTDYEHLLMALYKDECIGAVAFPKYKNKYMISSIGVHPLYQRKGIGKALVKRIIEKALEEKVKKIYVITQRVEFFESLGFKKDGRESGPMYTMRLEVRFKKF